MSQPRPKITVIVPCRNEAAHIRHFLEGLLAQDLDGFEWEAIVADGMSDDGTREILEEYARKEPRIRVIENRGRIVSTGLNEAIRAARGEIIVRMDVHTEYARDYVRRCVEVLEEIGADSVGGPWTAQADGCLARAIAVAFQCPFGAGTARSRRVSYEGPVDTVYLGCWRKSTFERVGLFDETLVRNQDDELNLRIVRAGGVVWQSPRIRSWYKPRGSLRALFRQYFQYGFWKVAVIRKHKLPASWRHLVPGLFVLANVALPGLWAVGRLAGAAWLAEPARALWLAQAAAYGVACAAASILAARKQWRLLPLLPVVFATYHVSYGLGFLAGVGHFILRPQPRQPGKLFTALSR
jgi:glycosyltransferase involved in cell wall biosynthesis